MKYLLWQLQHLHSTIFTVGESGNVYCTQCASYFNPKTNEGVHA